MWKQLKCLLTDEDFQKYYVYILFGHKHREISFATTLMDLEDIIVSKISQTQKDNNHRVVLIC